MTATELLSLYHLLLRDIRAMTCGNEKHWWLLVALQVLLLPRDKQGDALAFIRRELERP